MISLNSIIYKSFEDKFLGSSLPSIKLVKVLFDICYRFECYKSIELKSNKNWNLFLTKMSLNSFEL